MATLQWMGHLLRLKFFHICDNHRKLRKSEANIFCFECCSCLCVNCISSHSSSHHFLQIRRYVYRDVVKLSDMNEFIDCSKIQTFIVNAAKVILLNPKPYASLGFTGPSCSCLRPVVPPNLFCSIACKISIQMINSERRTEQEIPLSVRSRRNSSVKGARRRKGIPTRAHFF